MKAILKPILSFSKERQFNAASRKRKWTYFLLFYISFQILRALAVGIFAFLSYYFNWDFSNDVNQSLESLSGFERFLLVAILAPFLEELIYRLGLKFSIYNLSIAMVFIGYELFSLLLEVGFYNYEEFFITRIIAASSLGFLFFLLLKKSTAFYLKIKRFWKTYKSFVVWTSILLFGLAHLDNFNLAELPVFSYPAIILPYCVMGYFISLTRLKLGFPYAVLFHSLNNSMRFIYLGLIWFFALF